MTPLQREIQKGISEGWIKAIPDPADDECQHQWTFVKDWYGNPDVPNGTVDCSHWYCAECDTQTEEQPTGWEPPFLEEY